MFLAELIKEKDYIEDSIHSLKDHILDLVVAKDKTDYKINKSIIDERLEELDELYKKYQQFSVTLERTEASTAIKANGTELSLADASIIKDVLESRLQSFEYILDNSIYREKKDEGILCIDIDEVFKEIEKLKRDIKTLESQIDFATWQTEVK